MSKQNHRGTHIAEMCFKQNHLRELGETFKQIFLRRLQMETF